MEVSCRDIMKSSMTKGALVFMVSLTLLAAYPAHAQLGLPGVEKALSIKVEPLHPGPEETVRLTIHSSLLDLTGSAVVWRVDGKTIAVGESDTMEITTGVLGTQTEIEVSVAAADGTGASAEATITPTTLDLLVDSDSYTPPFFRGRPYASVGTNVHLQAIPNFIRSDGEVVANSEILYTWRQNGEVIGTITGRGKSTARIPVQHLYGTEKISVEARTSDGLLSNEASFSFTPIEPVLVLYQSHPLYGTLFHQALAPANFISETETTFVATPYFAQASGGNDPLLAYDWRVNGTALPRGGARSSEITINANNSAGFAQLELELTHATNFYTDSRGLWNITFSTSAAAGPFGGFNQ
jgi:hypothetical protein